MILAPPPGSTISVRSDGADTLVAIPYPASASRYFSGPFLLFWLGGWGYGAWDVGRRVLSGQASWFTMVWLAGWLAVGGAAIYMAFRLLRPSVPETLRLTSQGINYDSGVASVRHQTGNGSWQSTFPKRTRLELNRTALRTLQLRPTDTGNRLTVDDGAKRIDIAGAATEIEREWLYRVIASRYSLPSPDTSHGAAE